MLPSIAVSLKINNRIKIRVYIACAMEVDCLHIDMKLKDVFTSYMMWKKNLKHLFVQGTVLITLSIFTERLNNDSK